MITNADLIADSLRELGVINETQTPSAEQGAFALRRLNQVMAQLKADDINLQFFPQTSMSDACPIPDFAEFYITCLLAMAQAANYGKSVSPEFVASANAAWDTVSSAIVSRQLDAVTVVNRPHGQGWYRRHSRILTG